MDPWFRFLTIPTATLSPRTLTFPTSTVIDALFGIHSELGRPTRVFLLLSFTIAVWLLSASALVHYCQVISGLLTRIISVARSVTRPVSSVLLPKMFTKLYNQPGLDSQVGGLKGSVFTSKMPEYVHTLNTVSQRNRWHTFYRDSHHNSQNAGYWLSIVFINNEEYGRGEGSNVRSARERAAHQALKVAGYNV